MHLDELRNLCLGLPNVTEDQPFGPDTLVFRVGGKIFAITPLDGPDCRINLKCDPDRVPELREAHPESILPGYHMNKQHWNTVICDRDLRPALVSGLVRHSYDLIRASLPLKKRVELDELA